MFAESNASGLMPAGGAEMPSALILDLESNARHRLARDFEGRGFRVAAAETDEAGTSLALRIRPGLVVTELRLRSGSGLEVLAHLRPRVPNAKFVVVTSYGSTALRE
jgi:two-component system, response regulator RegA